MQDSLDKGCTEFLNCLLLSATASCIRSELFSLGTAAWLGMWEMKFN
jgi:hypothetical protein